MPAAAETKRYAAKVLRRLKKNYPEAKCSLDFVDPLQLLVSTILSAQCTDKRVNMVTPALFEKYPNAADYAAARQVQLEKDIKSTGFYRNKAKNIRLCCQELEQKHDGQVPDDMESLVALPGVGRKTANCVLGTAFGKAVGVVVDTHVGRIARRLGLSDSKDAEKVERDLMDAFPKKEWISLSHRLILHGRAICDARKPNCDECPLADVCPRVGVDGG